MKHSISTVDNNITVTLDQSAVRRSAQRLALRELIKANRVADAIAYLESFSGKEYTYINVPRVQNGSEDLLGAKRSGTIRRMFQEMFDTGREHRPDTDHQTYIGVEIECMVPRLAFPNADGSGGSYECEDCGGSGTENVYDDDGDEVIDSHDCRACEGSGRIGSDDDSDDDFRSELARHFRKQKVKYINVKDDGSIRNDDEYFACEITILTRLDKPTNLEMACAVLKTLGAKVNKSCGLHVHLDARHLTPKAVAKIGLKFSNALPVMLNMVPETRRKDNQYCQPSVSGLRGERYHAVNLTAHKKYKTIEVRLHSSTTDFKKIINWAKLMHAICVAKKLDKPCKDINELTNFIDIDERLMEYVAQRTALFSETETCTSNEVQDADAA